MYKVLIAEDEDIILAGIKKIIDWDELGLEVVWLAHNGQEALSMLEKEAVDIIITDINMPVMGGLELLSQVRSENRRTRFIILSGYDDFTYAQKAIPLSVENYILKPINEEKLQEVLDQTVHKLITMDNENKYSIATRQKLLRFLSGQMKEDKDTFIKETGLRIDKPFAIVANVKLKPRDRNAKELEGITSFIGRKFSELDLQTLIYDKDEFLIIFQNNQMDYNYARTIMEEVQYQIEAFYEITTFITISSIFHDLDGISGAFQETKKLQKYLIIAGYGNSIDERYCSGRKSTDISLDESLIDKLILAKDRTGISKYIDDLFRNHIEKEKITSDAVYHLAIKLALSLQRVVREFKLSYDNNIKNLVEVMEELFKADDLSDIKSIFLIEVMEIIDCINVGDSQYTPVVRQILSDLEECYKEDINLKVLAQKYCMNTSYLGQIFQKEVGMPFSQYLTNMKNSKAKDLILNTNLKINDIAKEVGYPDVSYFYRKFKQCYGTSPASLRELKQY
jgi:two-component system response regulator YesN